MLCAAASREAARGLPAIFVDDVVRATGHLAALLAGEPAERLALVGVTGTNGKTSCTYLLESIWRAAGIPCGCRRNHRAARAGLRAPRALDHAGRNRASGLSRRARRRRRALGGARSILARARAASCRGRDVQSGRVHEPDARSSRLPRHRRRVLRREAAAVLGVPRSRARRRGRINADDARCDEVRRSARGNAVVTYSGVGCRRRPTSASRPRRARSPGCAARSSVSASASRSRAVSSARANLANIAAAAATALATGVDPEAVGIGITQAAPVPGRLERVGDADPAVFVDYAHTPDALERTLAAVRQLAPARLVVVFGCGGDRDRGKRPLMGGIAARLADVVVLTSDNPRTEDPARSSPRSSRASVARDSARRRRSRATGCARLPRRSRTVKRRSPRASALREPADVVVIAGKGHEDYQRSPASGGRSTIARSRPQLLRSAMNAEFVAKRARDAARRAGAAGRARVHARRQRQPLGRARRALRRAARRALRRQRLRRRRRSRAGRSGSSATRGRAGAQPGIAFFEVRRHAARARRPRRAHRRRFDVPRGRDHRLERQDDDQGDAARDPRRRLRRPGARARDRRQPEQPDRHAADAARARRERTARRSSRWA